MSTRGPRLRIVAINDVYLLDNFPRLATLIAELVRADPVDRMLVTLAGDFLAPSLLSSLDQGAGMVAVLDAIGVTHVTFGNHEDDVDVVVLRQRMAELHAVWLGTNAPEFSPRLPARDIVTIAGPEVGDEVRVALIGVVVDDPTIYRRPPFGGTLLLPARATACSVATELVRDGLADLVVPLTHLPVAEDRLLAREQQTPPFRVILGGHDHTEVLEWIGDGPDKTCIAKAGHDAANAIIVELAWPTPTRDPNGKAYAPSLQVRLEPVAGYAEDPAIRTLVDQRMARVREVQDATLLRIPPGIELSSVGTRSRQTTVGQMLCTRLRDVLGADACILNGGGIRGSHTYRERFTYADLEVELPFDNEMTLVPLTGAELRAAIQSSRAAGESGGFLQVDDGVVVDADNIITAIAGAPLDPQRSYRVALMRNLLLGMDRIAPLMHIGATEPYRVPPVGCGREIKVVLVDAFGAMLSKQLGFERVDSNHDGVLSIGEISAGNALLDRGESPSG